MPGHRCLLWKASEGDDGIESHRINVRITIAIMKIMMMKIMMMMTMIAIMMLVKVMNLQQVQWRWYTDKSYDVESRKFSPQQVDTWLSLTQTSKYWSSHSWQRESTQCRLLLKLFTFLFVTNSPRQPTQIGPKIVQQRKRGNLSLLVLRSSSSHSPLISRCFKVYLKQATCAAVV